MKGSHFKSRETVCIYQDIKSLKYNILYVLIQSLIVISAYVPHMAECVEEQAASEKRSLILSLK